MHVCVYYVGNTVVKASLHEMQGVGISVTLETQSHDIGSALSLDS